MLMIIIIAVLFGGAQLSPQFSGPLIFGNPNFPLTRALVVSPVDYPRFGAPQPGNFGFLVAPRVPQNEDYNPQPLYSYGYSVEDAVTGDNKHHQETREGDVVRGSYSLIDPDGTRRIVEYVADPINGFNAIVRKEAVGVVGGGPGVLPVRA